VSRRVVVLFFLSIAVIYYTGLGTLPLLEPDEGGTRRSRGRCSHGETSSPAPERRGVPRETAALLLGNAASFALFGESEFSARFFTATVSIAGFSSRTGWGGSRGAPRRPLLRHVLCTSLYHYGRRADQHHRHDLAVAMIVAIFPAFLYLSGSGRAGGTAPLVRGRRPRVSSRRV